MQEFKISEEDAKDLQWYVDAHISSCFESVDDPDYEFQSGLEPFGVFCGCLTCQTREYLMAIFTFLRNRGIVDIYVGNIDLEDLDNLEHSEE
jgi:hypothetical protein